ncbi:endonuclease/exonuclease/phosphatase family protein [Umezawaea endophytica]|uniref:Endonuclease/exonuclease/phosphatase family protein n=1 Tax=Umezawaea endophytica TaxID=1654476 RepID=A0A9X2VU52_9PSEU|nr:endonuclease/exonuclease/phosphatase family protein [Umezawaea endophytica]MCS7482780.1 endonuclease/exonuclease/phosphatase family protein [Umezawaea endophytica]
MGLTALVPIVLLAATVCSPPAPRTDLVAMTFNVHAGIGSDGVFDLPRVADAIREQRPDVVGLQEVDVRWSERSGFVDEAAELGRSLGMEVFFAPIYDLPGEPRRQFGVAVLSRYPILRARNHSITRLSTQDPAAVPALAPGFAEAVVDAPGGPVDVFVTHLDFRPDPAVRATQVREMLAIMRGHRQVLLGDFNAEPGAPELAPLWERLVDAGGTATFPAEAPAQRLDYVAADCRLRVVDVRVPATGASDHLPVVARVAARS